MDISETLLLDDNKLLDLLASYTTEYTRRLTENLDIKESEQVLRAIIQELEHRKKIHSRDRFSSTENHN